MPSDATPLEALQVVANAIAAWQTRVTAVADRIGQYLAANDESRSGASETEQLGAFAAGRIDIERFSALWEERRALDQSDAEILFAEPCAETTGLGFAIADRLRRASAPRSI